MFQENKSTSAGSKVNGFRTEMELLNFKVKIESTFFRKRQCTIGFWICWVLRWYFDGTNVVTYVVLGRLLGR